MNNKVINVTSYLLCLLPLALLTGSFLPDLIISIIGIVFIIKTIQDREWFYYKNKFFIIFILFCLYLILRSLFSSNPLFSLESSLFYFRFGFFALGVWYLLNQDETLINRFFYFIVITFVLALLEGYFQVISYEFFGHDDNIIGIHCSKVRLCLTFNDKLALGGYLARLLPLVFALVLYKISINKNSIFLTYIALVIVLVLVYASGERTALALMIIFNFLIILLIKKYRYIGIITTIFSVILMTLVTLSSDEIKKRHIDHTFNQIFNSQNQDLNEKIYYSNQHDPIYFTALSIFLDNPVFGKGPKLFRVYCSKDEFNDYPNGCATHPHNTYIQLLAETGIVGLIFVLIFALYIARQLLSHFYRIIFNKNIILDDYQTCLLICFALTLFPFLPSQNVFNGWISIIYFLPAGFYLHSIHKDKFSKAQES